MALTEKQRQLAMLEMGVERAPVWKPHPALRHVVIRRICDGSEQRVALRNSAARKSFLAEQRKTLKAVRSEFRRNLDMKWTGEEP